MVDKITGPIGSLELIVKTNEIIDNLTGAPTWGSITGTLTDQTDLKNALDAKQAANTAVTHTASTAAGNTITPVYVASNGAATAISYTIAKSVPSNAEFTDTTYSQGTGISIDGTTINHSNSVTAGTIGTSSTTSGATLAIPYATFDAQGHITAKGTHTHTITGFLTGITSSDVTTALGFTPYSNANPSGYQANVLETVKVNGTAQTPTSKTVDITVPTSTTQLTNDSGFITSADLSGYQTTANLVTTITNTSTDTKYPSAKAVYSVVHANETAIAGNTSAIAANTTAIEGITTLIPAEATSSNQLADKSFVNSSISTNTANFIGTFASVAELEAYSGTLTNNDYAFVTSTDTAGNTVYNRYKYNSTGQEWIFEYALNNSSFTSDQWAAVNSGVTSSTKVTHTAGTAVGNTITPVYISSTGAATALSYTIAKSVPSDAKFTDTTYSQGTGISLDGTTINHSNTVTAGTVGTSSATSGSTLAVPYFVYDAQGHLTNKGTHTHTVTGFLTGITSGDVTTALGFTPYSNANPSGYQANVLETVKVNGTALTPSSKTVDISVPTSTTQLTNDSGYITGITSSMVTTALGYTPRKTYSTTNPALTQSGNICSWTVTHNLSSQNVQVGVYNVSTGDSVMHDVSISSNSALVVKLFSTSNISAGTYKVVVSG